MIALKEGPTDKERLDWLEANATYAMHSHTDGKPEGLVRWRRGHSGTIGVRKVIDSAMSDIPGGVHGLLPAAQPAPPACATCNGEGLAWRHFGHGRTLQPCPDCKPAAPQPLEEVEELGPDAPSGEACAGKPRGPYGTLGVNYWQCTHCRHRAPEDSLQPWAHTPKEDNEP